jgi:hypothetical protein
LRNKVKHATTTTNPIEIGRYTENEHYLSQTEPARRTVGSVLLSSTKEMTLKSEDLAPLRICESSKKISQRGKQEASNNKRIVRNLCFELSLFGSLETPLSGYAPKISNSKKKSSKGGRDVMDHRVKKFSYFAWPQKCDPWLAKATAERRASLITN